MDILTPNSLLHYFPIFCVCLGLDPAGPWFENYDHSTGINPGAAAFVDIIHTMAHK